MWRGIILGFLLIFGSAGLAGPSGTVAVIDADTFDVGGVRVRLFGIDAPEMGQPCQAQGREWDCGRWARDYAVDLYQGAEARCAQIDVDRYNRVVATCTIGGADVGERLVSDGVAWAYRRYSDRYSADERRAESAENGLWSVQIQMPADYRAGLAVGADTSVAGCVIKGNISASGRIYHVPGNRDYTRTKISASRGERWFCTTAEAEAAGWRAARR